MEGSPQECFISSCLGTLFQHWTSGADLRIFDLFNPWTICRELQDELFIHSIQFRTVLFVLSPSNIFHLQHGLINVTCSANWPQPPYISSGPCCPSQSLHPLKRDTISLLLLRSAHPCESTHLDRRYFNRCKNMQKMHLASRSTCSHVEGMWLQLTFQSDFLGQFLEPQPPHRHMFALSSPLSDCIVPHSGFRHVPP